MSQLSGSQLSGGKWLSRLGNGQGEEKSVPRNECPTYPGSHLSGVNCIEQIHRVNAFIDIGIELDHYRISYVKRFPRGSAARKSENCEDVSN